MAEDFTTSQLISDIKRRGSVPVNQGLFSEQDLCDLMTDCQKLKLIPLFLRAREEYFVSSLEIHLSQDEIEYSIPGRAIGNKIRQVLLLDPSGNECELTRIQPENRIGSVPFNNLPLMPNGYNQYYFKGNKIVLVGRPSGSETLRIYYYRRPSRLVTTDKSGTVTNINMILNTITLDNVPTSFVTGQKLDIVTASEPFEAVFDSAEIVNVSGFNIELAPEAIAKIEIGNIVCLEHQTTIPQFPLEAHQLLVHYCLVKIMASMDDRSMTAMFSAELNEMEQNLLTMIEGRDDGNPQKVVSNRGLWR